MISKMLSMRCASKSLFKSARFFSAAPIDQETFVKVTKRQIEKMRTDFNQENNMKQFTEIRRKAMREN